MMDTMPVAKTASSKKTTTAKKAAAKKPVKKVAEKTTKTDLFAVIETGGKQYQVTQGKVITIERIKELTGKDTGAKVIFDKVLLVDNGKDTQIGDPYLKGAKVEGTLEEEGKGKKIRIVRFKSKSRYLKQTGHRQPHMRVKIVTIS